MHQHFMGDAKDGKGNLKCNQKKQNNMQKNGKTDNA